MQTFDTTVKPGSKQQVIDMAKHIRAAMERKGISQRDLALKCRLSATGFSVMLHKGSMKVETLIRIADALECSVMELMGIRLNLQPDLFSASTALIDFKNKIDAASTELYLALHKEEK